MTKKEAEKILREKGWNDYGIDAILSALPEGALDKMTKEELEMLSDDYADR